MFVVVLQSRHEGIYLQEQLEKDCDLLKQNTEMLQRLLLLLCHLRLTERTRCSSRLLEDNARPSGGSSAIGEGSGRCRGKPESLWSMQDDVK